MIDNFTLTIFYALGFVLVVCGIVVIDFYITDGHKDK